MKVKYPPHCHYPTFTLDYQLTELLHCEPRSVKRSKSLKQVLIKRRVTWCFKLAKGHCSYSSQLLNQQNYHICTLTIPFPAKHRRVVHGHLKILATVKRQRHMYHRGWGYIRFSGMASAISKNRAHTTGRVIACRDSLVTRIHVQGY